MKSVVKAILLMRISLKSLLVVVAVISVCLKLNLIERRTVVGPYMPAGSTMPTTFSSMLMDVRYHKGWPLCFAEHIDTFVAANAPIWLHQDRWKLRPLSDAELEEESILDVRQRGPLILQVSPFKVACNVCISLLLGLGCGMVLNLLATRIQNKFSRLARSV
ncbi:MAG: hypothetical protein U0930_02945 [Pirellulales bacterium]